MTKKKITYIIILIIVLILGYFNYFGEEKQIKEIKKVVETKNAIYESDDYYVEAEKEFDYIDEKESKFEKAKSKIKGMLLKGDNILLDKARNLILNNNIIGISPNGWEINASELRYIKEKDELVSQELVTAKNKEKGIEISGKKFKTNISMDYIILEDGVTIKNKVLSLYADKAKYSSDSKKIVLEGNIKILGANSEDKNSFSGQFKEVYYNLDERNLYASNGFEINYGKFILLGDNLILNDKDENFKIEGNIKLKYEDYSFDLARIEKYKNDNIINIYGKIKGGNKVYSLLADKGYYNTDTKKFEIMGNIEINSINFEKLVANKIDYNLETKEIEVFGNQLKYTSPTNNLEAEHIIYNTETKIINTDKIFYAYNEKQESIKGTNFVYSVANKGFLAKNNITLATKDYEISGADISYVEDTGLLTVPNKFELKIYDKNTKIIGETLLYNKKTGDLKTENILNLYSKTLSATGKNLNYNTITKLGKIDGNIEFEDKENNMSGNAKEILINGNENIELTGPISIVQNGANISTQNIKYLYSDSLIHIDNLLTFKNDEKGMSATVEKGTYDPKTSIFKGYTINAKDNNRAIKSDEVYLYTKDDIIEFSKNVFINSEKNSLKTQNLVYHKNSEDIKLKNSSEILYEGYKINLDSGNINNKTGVISINNISIEAKDRSKFDANRVSGNINEGLVHFNENVRAKVYNDKDEEINFNGEMLDLYLEKIENQFQAKKIVMNKKGIFTQLNKELKSDSIEADLLKNVVYIKNRPIAIIDNGINGKTTIEADNAIVHINTKVLSLNGNIYVKDFNKNNEEVTMLSNEAELKNNILTIYDKIKIMNKESTLTANEGYYDMNAKKIKLSGNVHVDYVTEKGAGK